MQAIGMQGAGAPGTRGAVIGTTRQCSRTGCAERATVTLTYHYGRSHAWLDELTRERDPHAYDLCDRHADRLSVPSGWSLDDRRAAHLPLIAV